MPININILFLAVEAYPYIKVGGLADVAGSLPFALRSLSAKQAGGYKLDVRLVLPLHRIAQNGLFTLRPLTDFTVTTKMGEIKAQAYESSLNGVPTYFIDGLPISRSDFVYSPNPEIDREKYTFFSLAALELARKMNFKVDIVHANDWHTALSVYAIRTIKEDTYYLNTKGILTVHNLPYMGGDSGELLDQYGFQKLLDTSVPVWARTQALPLGLWAADAIIPVSKTYAKEILTPEFGCGLQGLLQSRADVITGIINGLDLYQWDPAKDDLIISNYSVDNLDARLKNKITLLQKLDLDRDPHKPLIGMVTRIDYQKGIDLTIKALPLLKVNNWQMVILGAGDESIEEELSQLQEKYPDQVRVILRYDNSLSHLIYAGSDIFLMPSRYEPCGLSQMIAMRYGSVPVVHATGGLKDTVEKGITGFTFDDSSSESQADALRRALKVFSEPDKWLSLQRNGMKKDFSWTRSAIQYSILYRSIAFNNLPGGEQ